MENKQGLLENLERERLISSALGQSEWLHDDKDDDVDVTSGCLSSIGKKIGGLWSVVKGVVIKAYEMGQSDPRKVVFSGKLGLALALISLLIFWKEPFPDISEHYVWAILTVVVVFEFSIGISYPYFFNFLLCSFDLGWVGLKFDSLCEF